MFVLVGGAEPEPRPPKGKYAFKDFEEWRNNVNFFNTQQHWNAKLMTRYYGQKKLKKVLQLFQYHTVLYMIGVEHRAVPRGLLLYFQMGTGKTLTAIASALFAVHTQPRYRGLHGSVVVFVSKMLRLNFEKEVRFYCRLLNAQELSVTLEARDTHYSADDLLDFFRFVIINDPTHLNENFDQEISFAQNETKFVIMDEAHNFIRAVNNNSKAAQSIYFKLQKLRDVQILLLSGTVISNDSKEVALMFQLLSGNERLFDTRLAQISVTRIEFNDNFNKFFVKDNLVNKQILLKRQMGLTAYVDLPLDSFQYPQMKPIKHIQVKIENELHVLEYRDAAKTELIAGDSFMQQTRKLSNCYVSSATQLSSPKFEFVWTSILKNKKKKALIFSSFVEFGLEAFIKYIKQNPRGQKVLEVDPHQPAELQSDEVGYILISGETAIEQRRAILDSFNAPENSYGQRCNIILFSPASAEGVSLKDTRKVFILEP